MTFDCIVLGGGASGLFLASMLQDLDLLIIEHNRSPGAKIAISGGGRANVTNKHLSSDNYHTSDPLFVKKVLDRFDNEDLLEWMKRRGCEAIERKPNQFFCPNSARELIDLLRPKGTLKLGCEIEGLEDGLLRSSCGTFRGRTVVVATGGLSYKRLGASGIGYEIAKDHGHEVTFLRPALVGLTVQKEQFWFKELSGISLRARVNVGERSFEENILFAHKGISGPAILNASLYWERGEIEIVFLKNVARYLRYPKRKISSQLPLPKRFIKKFLESIGVVDQPLERLTKEQRNRLRLLEGYRFAPAGTFGFERAEVTKGGISLDGIGEYMQSLEHPWLFFVGEVLDVTGELGGYNFQWAFSSAYVAAQGVRRYLSRGDGPRRGGF